MTKQNIKNTVKNGLCLGCGVCEDVCPRHCIIIQKGRLNIPRVDNNACTNCGLCLRVCAGHGVEIKGRSQILFSEATRDHRMIGRYLDLYKGFSTDYDIRYHSASGGCLTHFLIWLLDNKVIDGAVVTKFMDDDHMTPKPFIARTKEDLLAGKSSKYCVVSMEGIMSEIKNTDGKYVIVGLPCHIHAVRKSMDVDKRIRERVVGCFAIYCSSNKTMDSQRYLLYRYGVDRSKLNSFAYRDNGCLGSMFFRDKEGNNIVEPIYYLDYYLGMRAFFSVPRCSLCNDFFGELADISFGDLNTGRVDDDKIGINSIITRSQFWHNLLKESESEGVLHLDGVDENTIVDAQSYCKTGKKGPGFYANMKLRLFLRKAVPDYDNMLDINPGIREYVKVLATAVQRFIGRHEILWPVIRELDKKKAKF